MRIAVITGTTREGRFSGLVAEWITAHLAAQPDIEVEGIDLRDHLLPFFDGVAPARTGREYPRDDVAQLGRAIDRSDAFVVLTGEYNHGYPAVLKNAMDWTFVEWRRKPITFVGWGQVGGARAVEQLRQVAIEFEMAPLRFAVHVLPDVMLAARQAGDDADVSLFAGLEARADQMVDDLRWWTEALNEARTRHELATGSR
jgi:NAD(P)H-dependent FMN reductase